jgi:hypothetical protein
MAILQLIHSTNFELQVTFTTKILIVTLNKLHLTLVVNDKEFWMQEKVNKIQFHPLTKHIHLVVYD